MIMGVRGEKKNVIAYHQDKISIPNKNTMTSQHSIISNGKRKEKKREKRKNSQVTKITVVNTNRVRA